MKSEGRPVGGALAVLALLGLFLMLYASTTEERQHRADQNQIWTVNGEVDALVAKKRDGKIADASTQLERVMETNPHRVLVPLAISHARIWPHIDEKEAKRLIGLCETDSIRASAELEDVLRNRVLETAAPFKQNPTEAELRSWYGSNAATRILFIDFPLSQLLGKEREFLKQELEWQLDGAPQWFAPDLTLEQYYDARK
jgi:hypothetical protein